MHITLETDYAIRIVDALAHKKIEPLPEKDDGVGSRRRCLDAKTISEQTGVPPRFTLKILHKLVGGGIVRSFKGVYGGYELARELPELSLCDVVELMEGEYRFSRCLSDGYSCSCCSDGDKLPCAYQNVYANISLTVRDILKQQTFDKFVK